MCELFLRNIFAVLTTVVLIVEVFIDARTVSGQPLLSYTGGQTDQSHAESNSATGTNTVISTSVDNGSNISTAGLVSSNTQNLQYNNGTEPQRPYKYVGNRYSHKFHRPGCPFARAMSSWNTEYFCFRKDAVEHGEKPCRYCLPPWWKSVSATIVKTDNAAEMESGHEVTTEVQGASTGAFHTKN